MMAVCLSLNEVGALPYETVVDVIADLANSSVTDFMKLFDFLFEHAKVKALDTDTHEEDTLSRLRSF